MALKENLWFQFFRIRQYFFFNVQRVYYTIICIKSPEFIFPNGNTGISNITVAIVPVPDPQYNHIIKSQRPNVPVFGAAIL